MLDLARAMRKEGATDRTIDEKALQIMLGAEDVASVFMAAKWLNLHENRSAMLLTKLARKTVLAICSCMERDIRDDEVDALASLLKLNRRPSSLFCPYPTHATIL